MAITIDPEFRDLIPRPSDEEFAQLEANILAAGEITDPLVVWKGRGILLDGHNRYAIAEQHGLTQYQVYESEELPDRQAAIRWIARRQLGRRNLTDFARAELALLLEPTVSEQAKAKQLSAPNSSKNGIESEKTSFLEKSTVRANLPERATFETRQEIAKEAGVSARTVNKVQRVKKSGTSELQNMARSGEVSIDAAAKVANLPSDEQAAVVAAGPKAVKEKAAEIRAVENAPIYAPPEKEIVQPVENDTFTDPSPQVSNVSEPPKLDPEKPWAEYESAIKSITSDLRSIRVRLQAILGYDAKTKQNRAKWAHFASSTGTVGAISELIRYIEASLPERLDPTPPGYVSVELASARKRQGA